MPKKVLFCATVDSHFKAFHIPYLKFFKEEGWEVHVAANGDMELPFVDKKYNITINRSPYRLENINAYRQLKKVIYENKYDIIHCHTPMGGVFSRLAARKAETKVIYTAHGFNFYKKAPLRYWLLYYPVEKWLAGFTDCLITINMEDYCCAVKRRFKAKRVEYVPGVGVDVERFKPVNDSKKHELREKYGYKPDDFLMFYAAEFNKNKNQQLLINALTCIKDRIPNTRLLLAGKGKRLDYCRKLGKKLGVSEMICFLGFRDDLDQILPMCDIAVASSLREGLPVNIMEAMACGLPVVASDNRGHRDLIKQGRNGFLIKPNSCEDMYKAICKIYKNRDLMNSMCVDNVKDVITFSLEKVEKELKNIYNSMF